MQTPLTRRNPAAQWRTARRVCRRATPATLAGVVGLPTTASALSVDNVGPPCDDHCGETGAAHMTMSVAANAAWRISEWRMFFSALSLL